MDPLASNGAAQSLDIKAFVHLFGNANLQSFTHSACINTNSILHGIFEGLEAQLLEFKASLATKIGRATEAGPANTTQNADVPRPVSEKKPLFAFLCEFVNFNDCILANVPKSSPTERLKAFSAWMIAANAPGSEELRKNDLLCQDMAASKVIEAADNAMRYI